MRAWELIADVYRKTGTVVWSLYDAFPPYYVTVGKLISKDVREDGECVLHVNGANIRVDRPTFEAISVGERLRIRYTRGVRAINIDRFISTNGHG